MPLEGRNNIPFVTIGDVSFLGIHGFKRDTMKTQLTNNTFNKKLCSAQVVTEHAYGMLKYRWRILYKKTECRLHNLTCNHAPHNA